MKKSDGDPLHAANSAPRCKAKSQRTGLPCRNPAVRGWEICRMHGARGGSKPGKAHPNWKHGERSKEAVERRKLVAQLVEAARDHCVE